MHQFQVDTTPTAAKVHRCDECGRTIPKGVKHHLQKGVFDGAWYTWRVHADCAELYWRANRHYYRWDDDMMRLCDFDISELEPWRGHFPHAVTRLELGRALAEIEWQKRANQAA